MVNDEKLVAEALMYQLEAIAGNLNEALITLLGEDADWKPSDAMPKDLRDRISSERLRHLAASVWAIREEANGALHWVDGRDE